MWFSLGAVGYDRTLNKWQAANPAIMGTWPAAALLFLFEIQHGKHVFDGRVRFLEVYREAHQPERGFKHVRQELRERHERADGEPPLDYLVAA